MLKELSPAFIVSRREIRDQFRDWRIIIPIITLTLIFPALMNFTARQAIQFVENYGAFIIGDRLIPFLLMIVGFFPISISLVIALESFVGEKERKSIEPLLATPLRDWQLYLGKLMAVLVPPLLASFLGISVFLIGVYRQVGWTPDPELLTQVVLLTIVQALVMVAGAVVISSQATSVRAANLLASFIIIPMAFLIMGESLVMFWGRYYILWWTIFGLMVFSILLLRSGVSHFNREEVLGREIDSLNFRWGGRVFVRAFRGQATSLGSWYRYEVFGSLKKMRLGIFIMAGILIAAVLLGASQASVFRFPPEVLNIETIKEGSIGNLQAVSLFSTEGVLLIFFHNLRAILLASVLGIFSFGIFGIITLMIAPALLGYLMATLSTAGLSPLVFLSAFILPHGLFEIPAIVIAGTLILNLGSSLVAPAEGRSIGEALLDASATWMKIMVAVVIPLLILGALTEALVTPQVAIWILSR